MHRSSSPRDLHTEAGSFDPRSTAASARVVNRTHRIVREQALAMREQKQTSRGLLVPVAICSTLLLVSCYAVWTVLDGNDLTPNGVPDASDQLMLLVLWSLPVTLAVIGFIWLQRGRGRFERNGETGR